ncbi:cytochrome P450 2B11-like [Rhinophrynus dorsalis]
MYRRKNLPPGPTPLPIIGNLLQLKTGRLLDSLQEMKHRYGDIYTLFLGTRRVVVLCGYDIVKEALLDQGEEFGFRGHLPVIEASSKGQGVIFSNGEDWKHMRRFSLMTLKNFGMGKRSIKERVKEEAHCLIEELKKTKGVAINPEYYFSQVASNIISSIIFGKRFSYDDPEFLRLMKINHGIIKSVASFWGQLYILFEVVMKYLPGPHHRIVQYSKQMDEFVRERMETEKKTINPGSPRHMIDSFLIKMEEEKQNPLTPFNMDNFFVNTSSFFVAGSEAVSTTLRHGFLLLLKYPKIRCKVQEEIDQIIGRRRAPEPEDRVSMPYTDAVIHEIQRYGNVLPMNVPRTVIKDTQFRGYTITKGTDILPVLTFVLWDPKYFPDPHIFNPDRFLDANGKFKKNKAFLPFSAGKRVCLAEPLSRLEIFIFMTTVLQHFDITSSLDPEEIDLSPEMGGFYSFPKPYKISFNPR